MLKSKTLSQPWMSDSSGALLEHLSNPGRAARRIGDLLRNGHQGLRRSLRAVQPPDTAGNRPRRSPSASGESSVAGLVVRSSPPPRLRAGRPPRPPRPSRSDRFATRSQSRPRRSQDGEEVVPPERDWRTVGLRSWRQESSMAGCSKPAGEGCRSVGRPPRLSLRRLGLQPVVPLQDADDLASQPVSAGGGEVDAVARPYQPRLARGVGQIGGVLARPCPRRACRRPRTSSPCLADSGVHRLKARAVRENLSLRMMGMPIQTTWLPASPAMPAIASTLRLVLRPATLG